MEIGCPFSPVGACKKFFHSLCGLINCSCSVPIFSRHLHKNGMLLKKKSWKTKIVDMLVILCTDTLLGVFC